MSEPNPTDPVDPPEGNGPPVDPPVDDGAIDKEAARKLRSENAAMRARLKAAEPAAAKWDAHAKTQQTEADRWAAEKAELSSATQAAQRKAWQYEAAGAAGLPLDMASRLQGDDLASMIDDAKEFAKTVLPPAPVAPRRRSDPSQGAGQQGGRDHSPLNGSPDPIEEMLRAHLGITG